MVLGTEFLHHSNCVFSYFVSVLYEGHKILNYLFICKSRILSFSSQSYAGKKSEILDRLILEKGLKMLGEESCMTKLHSFCAGSHLFPRSINQPTWLALCCLTTLTLKRVIGICWMCFTISCQFRNFQWVDCYT